MHYQNILELFEKEFVHKSRYLEDPEYAGNVDKIRTVLSNAVLWTNMERENKNHYINMVLTAFPNLLKDYINADSDLKEEYKNNKDLHEMVNWIADHFREDLKQIKIDEFERIEKDVIFEQPLI